MKKFLPVLFIISLCLFGCKKPRQLQEIDINSIIDRIELTSSKTELNGNNKDEAILKVVVTNASGKILNENFRLTLNGLPFEGDTFKTAIPGDYIFQASVGKFTSNMLTIKASENLDGKPHKIVLMSNRSVLETGAHIRADNISEAMFSVKVTDINGASVNHDYELTLDGKPFSGNRFKTDKQGEYTFRASIGPLRSNLYKITADDLIEKYVAILSSKIKDISPTGSLIIEVKCQNISNQKLRGTVFNIVIYNTHNEIIKNYIGFSSTPAEIFGPNAPNEIITKEWNLGSFPNAAYIIVTLNAVILEDGTNIYAD